MINQDMINHDVHEDEWLLVPAPNTSSKFKKAIKRIIKLLRLRRIFASSGHWLQTVGKRIPGHPDKPLHAHIFNNWPKTILKRTAVIFNHLERRNGVLLYKQ